MSLIERWRNLRMIAMDLKAIWEMSGWRAYMRVAVMGSGGLGGLFGGFIASVGADVLFIARGAHLAAMRTNGLRIKSETGDFALETVQATDNPDGSAIVDYVIFTVKGQDTKIAAELVAPIVGPETAIVSLQNGVEWLDILSSRFKPESVIPGTTMTPAMIEAPGVIRHVGTNLSFTIGDWHGRKSRRMDSFAEIARKSGIEVTISNTIHVDVWVKFVTMATVSALTCLTRLPVRTLAKTLQTRELAKDGMREVMAVAAALGIDIPADLPEKTLALMEAFDPNWKTSMCNDLEAGKPIEVDSISGVVHRLGQDLGVATPIHSVSARALSPYAARGLAKL